MTNLVRPIDRNDVKLSAPVLAALEASIAPATRKAYRSDWNDFTTWCSENGHDALPSSPESLSAYIVERSATLKASTLKRRLSSISAAHRMAGHPSPTTNELVAKVWRGTRNTLGHEFNGQKRQRPLMTSDLRHIVHALNDRVIDDRDRALLTIGFAGGMRRSELVGLDIEDLDHTDHGLVITIRRSKTDQAGIGRIIGLPYAPDPRLCPVRSAATWIGRAQIESGPLFRAVNRSGQVAEERLGAKAVWRIVRKHAAAIGLDPTEFGAHSLRSGLATSATRAGASDRSIMAITGHRSRVTLDNYIHAGHMFDDNAAAAALSGS